MTMSRPSTLSLLAALGLGVSACAPHPGPLTAANNPSLSSVHQPVVQRTDYVLDLRSSGNGLADDELARLDAWLASIGAGYGDRLSVDEPQGYSDPMARDAVARVATGYGLELADGAPVLNGVVQPGTIRVIASRTTASVPGCPAWSEEAEYYAPPMTSSNYGCATNSNLAAMIADPEDLVLGQEGTTTGSGTTATRAVRTYRSRQPSGGSSLPSPGGM
jgi:pilus assembly protein CpaD